jgi:hypothetical protein
MNLYRVTLRGLIMSPWGTSYVVATDPTAAYEAVRVKLERRDYGFRTDRELSKVELIACAEEHHNTPSQLVLPATESNP